MNPRVLPQARRLAQAGRTRDWTAVRIRLAGALFMLGLAVLLGRAAWLAVANGEWLNRIADSQHVSSVKLTCPRGSILDRNGDVLAENIDLESLFVDPRALADQDRQGIARQIALVLDMPVESVLRSMQYSVGGELMQFAWIKRHLDRDQSAMIRQIIEEQNLRGVHLQKESHRDYPNRTLAAHVLGFTDVDSLGLEGLEHSYDRYLRGEPGRLVGQRDALGRVFFPEGIRFVGSKPGAALRLTLDSKIQAIAERELDRVFRDSQAVSAMLVVMDANTGELLALANRPTFDPNVARAFPSEYWRNRAIGDLFEPGSVLKMFTYAGAIQAGVIQPDQEFDCENGMYVFGSHRIHDAHPHGVLTARGVIKVSSNIGASKIAQLLGADGLYATLRDFGFGRPSGVDLPGETGETASALRPVSRWAKVDLATHSFGQGVAVTTLQLVTATAAAVNGGVLLRPYIVDRVIAPDGAELYCGHPTIRGRVISEQTSREVLQTLIGVTEPGGTATTAALPYCAVAGKTGTAQRPYGDRRGYSDEVVASFVGAVPAEQPRLAIAVVIESPQGPEWARYGGTVAGPVFRAVADESMAYLRLIPGRDEPVAPAQPARGEVARVAPPKESVSSGSAALPDFEGMSVRQAFALAERAGIELQAEGSGICVAQFPGPGAAPEAGNRVLARFANPEALNR